MLSNLRQLLGDTAFKSVWKRYLPLILITFILLIFGKLCTVSLSWFVKNLVDTFSTNNKININEPISISSVLLFGYGIALIGNVGFNELKQMLATKFTLRFMEEIAQHTFLHILRLPFDFFIGQKSGVITRDYERGLRGIQSLSELLLYSALPTAIELILIFSYIYLNYHGVIISVIGISVIIHISLSIKISGRWAILREKYNNAESQCNQRLNDCLINIESVKLFCNEELETKKFVNTFRNYSRAFFESQRYCAYLNTTQQFILAIAVVFVLWNGYFDVQNGVISIGDWVMLNSLLLQIYSPLNLLGIFYKDTRQSLVDIETLVKLSTLPVEKNKNLNEFELSGTPFISFENIGFSYKKNLPILKDVSFNITPNTFNAIVGHSGSGKSSLIKLLTRLQIPENGYIFFNGVDLMDIDLKYLREFISVISQDNTLFNTTIFDNIRYGYSKISEEDMINAAKLAHIHDFIMSLPNKYDTEVGERGMKISGGQRQRLLIARALTRKPRILILDEGTSALDSITEKNILDLLHSIKNITIIMIAHKLTNIISADQIVVFEKGKLVATGKHYQLLNNSIYNELWINSTNHHETISKDIN